MNNQDNTELNDAFVHLIDQIATRRVTDEDITSTKQALLLWKDREVIKARIDEARRARVLIDKDGVYLVGHEESLDKAIDILERINQLQSNLKEKE